jgi:hypothetical protein
MHLVLPIGALPSSGFFDGAKAPFGTTSQEFHIHSGSSMPKSDENSL